jgi:hypothetical protein
MTPQDWESPATSAAKTGAPARENSELAAAYALRPLSTGEVLDRTFSIYRSRFWLFAGLASLAGSFSLILNALQLIVQHVVLLHHGFRIAAFEGQASTVIMAILMLPVSAVVYAASVFALCEVYLGREITAKGALRATIGRWARYVGIGLWQGWSAIWVFFFLGVPAAVLFGVGAAVSGSAVVGGVLIFVGFLGGGVYGVIAYIRNSLGIPAALMEQTGVRASMRRSKTLAAGTKGRIFVVLLVAAALYLVAGAIQSPMLFFIARAPLQEHVLAQAAILLIGFISHTLVSPVALIGLTLVYFDQRVRKEAFDLVMLLGGEAPAPVATAVAAPVAAPLAAPVAASGDHGAEAGGDPADPIGNDDRV